MKFLKKAVSLILTAAIMVSMVCTGTVCASADNSSEYSVSTGSTEDGSYFIKVTTSEFFTIDLFADRLTDHYVTLEYFCDDNTYTLMLDYSNRFPYAVFHIDDNFYTDRNNFYANCYIKQIKETGGKAVARTNGGNDLSFWLFGAKHLPFSAIVNKSTVTPKGQADVLQFRVFSRNIKNGMQRVPSSEKADLLVAHLKDSRFTHKTVDKLSCIEIRTEIYVEKAFLFVRVFQNLLKASS